MLYESTRGKIHSFSAARAIKSGMAPDGGLFVPSVPIHITKQQLNGLVGVSYQERALYILNLFLTDFTPAQLKESITGSYHQKNFPGPKIAPVKKLNAGLYLLELWHGPTGAFKDFALQILPCLLRYAVAKTGEDKKIAILVATSGDTGKAALEGFKDVEGTKIIVFYPAEGVSKIQELQMVTQEGSNVRVVAVRGNFDQTQRGVKEIFKEMPYLLPESPYCFSSANSINWGRLVPQIVYYFSAYLDLQKQGEITPPEEINFVVPTGNFGNILAAFYARQMGLPVRKLICATNQNNVLADFIRTGFYDRNRTFYQTISPSMDILVASNLERLLYEVTGHKAVKVEKWMTDLQEKGRFQVDNDVLEKVKAIFWSDFATDEETLTTIKDTYRQYDYVLDPHTAVGKNVYAKYFSQTGDASKTVLVSTASPFKFCPHVVKAILGEKATQNKSAFELLDVLARTTGLEIPPGLKNLAQKTVRHTLVIDPAGMKQTVINSLTS